MAVKHIIVTELFEFGGSNTHLRTLIKYFGAENIILVLEREEESKFVANIDPERRLDVRIKPKLHKYADLQHRFSTNLKELYHIARSIITMQLLSLQNGLATITVNAVKPEKHLYLMWVPLCRVNYILHTTPHARISAFTSYTCNTKLNERNRLVTVSGSNKDLLCNEWSVNLDKQEYVHVIHNCIVEKKYAAAPRRGKIKNILTLGHVTEYKNPQLWLEVARYVTSSRNDIQFIWLGDGPLYDYFKNETVSSTNIRFVGFVSDPQDYFSSATIYYQPSLQETHGISVVEAMANYLPCIVSETGGLTESVIDQYNGLVVDPCNAQAHIEAILTLADDPNRCRAFGLHGHQKYESEFNYQTFRTKMDTLYKQRS